MRLGFRDTFVDSTLTGQQHFHNANVTFIWETFSIYSQGISELFYDSVKVIRMYRFVFHFEQCLLKM
jgi:hypothetical protein